MTASLFTDQMRGLNRVEPATQKSMIEQDRDLELIHRMAKGDQSALSELYAVYGQRMYAYALRLVNDAALAEDITQDVLIAAWKAARKFRGEGRVIAWLLGIVHHTAMKALRRRKPQVDVENMAETISATGFSPEENVQNLEQILWVRASLQQLAHRSQVKVLEDLSRERG
jgi:RNA polymerase sigma-70 factor, ECF subfamily